MKRGGVGIGGEFSVKDKFDVDDDDVVGGSQGPLSIM